MSSKNLNDSTATDIFNDCKNSLTRPMTKSAKKKLGRNVKKHKKNLQSCVSLAIPNPICSSITNLAIEVGSHFLERGLGINTKNESKQRKSSKGKGKC